MNSIEDEKVPAARKEAARRQRRLIIDDDGDVVYDEQTDRGPDAFCELRLSHIPGTPADSIAWCIMWGIAIKGGNRARYWQTQRCGVPFLPDMPDPTPVVVQFCRRHGMEVFGCIRMNDCHDAFGLPFDRLVYPLKAESPHPGESSSAPGGAEPPVSRWRCHFRRKSTRRSNYR